MIYKNKILQINQLDQKLRSLKDIFPERPAIGWLKSIRMTIGMTASQLGKKLYKSQQAIHAFEKGELEETITLAKLREVAAAMGFKLVYALVPEDSIEKLIEAKAKDLAAKIVMRSSHQMAMENQKISDNKLEQAINERAAEYTKTIPKILWD